MRTIFRFVPWKLLIRGFKGIVAGALTSVLVVCALSNITLDQYCLHECSVQSWLTPIPTWDRIFLDHIRDNVIDPPQTRVEDPLTEEEVQKPYYMNDISWYGVQVLAMEYLKNFKKGSGVFVEVGAGDGFYRSFSAKLEVLEDWHGLLVEPREEAYKALRRRRKAAAANVCATPSDYHGKDILWTPKSDDDLPEELKISSEARAALVKFVLEEDRVDGDIREIQCFTLESLIDSYLERYHPNRTLVDLLILDTSVGEVFILEQLNKKRFIMAIVKFHDAVERDIIQEYGKDLDLKMEFTESLEFSYAILMHKSITIVKIDAGSNRTWT